MAQVAKGKTTTSKVVKTIDYARLGFGKLANSNSGSLEEICTVIEACGPNGQFGFTSKNWKRALAGKKLLAVKIVNPDSTENPVTYIPCSVAVTEMLLSGEIKMKHLAGLPIQETDEGRLKVTLPEGSSVDQMVDAMKVKAETLEFSDGDFLPTDLLEI